MRRIAPILATLLVLSALAADKALLRPVPAVADTYHARVREAADELPWHLGPWLGTEVPVPQAAVQMLKPNAIIAREFRNIETGERVTLLFVHVRDARDIIGHYPPVCYRSQGWSQINTRSSDWSTPERVLQGTEYTFSRGRLEGSTTTVVDNFLMLPGGETCRDMDAIELAAQDRLWKLFGASQVQFIHDGSVRPERRREIVEEIVYLLQPVLNAISNRDLQ
jgi:hypothetical protein